MLGTLQFGTKFMVIFSLCFQTAYDRMSGRVKHHSGPHVHHQLANSEVRNMRRFFNSARNFFCGVGGGIQSFFNVPAVFRESMMVILSNIV